MAGEQLDMEALADACMRRRAAIGGTSSAWIKRMDEANRDVDALLAEVRRLQAELHKVTGERNGWNIAAHEAEEKLGEALTEARAEVRRLRSQIEARDRALDDVSKFMEWRAARRAVETVSINSFVQPGGDL